MYKIVLGNMNKRQSLHSVILGLSLVTISLLFSSCTHEAELPPVVPGTTYDSVCFESEILPVIQSNCAKSGCHDGAEEFALQSYADILSVINPGHPNDSELYEVITENQGSDDFMPPSPNQPLTSEQINKIELWILEGARYTRCSQQACDSLNVSFASTIVPIIETHCKGCHSGATPSASLSLTSYDQVKSAVSNKFLLDHIQQTNGYSLMPPSASLSSCQLAQFRRWINDGTPNN